MAIKPLGLTASDFMQAILNTEGHDPWHERDYDDWRWHASELSSCPRQLMYKRSRQASDPRPMEGQLTMLVGTMFHERMERGIASLGVLGRLRPVVVEVGHYHATLPLAAKPDALVEIEGVGLVLLDLKTEHENASKRRTEDAREAGRRSNIRPEHALQLAATASVLESNGYGPIVQGHALYVSKNSFWLGEPSANSVDLSDGLLYKEVARKVNNLEAMWDDYVRDQELPSRYEDKHWNCRPDKKTGLGMYCPAFKACRG